MKKLWFNKNNVMVELGSEISVILIVCVYSSTNEIVKKTLRLVALRTV